MKLTKFLLAFLLLCATGLGYAWADHRHARNHPRFDAHIGVVIGPYWRPWAMYYPSPYYYPPYYPPVVVERYHPPVYIEQAAPPSSAPSAAIAPPPASPINYWYFCGASKAYYPYVQECPGGWQKVLPKPPGQP